MKKILTSLFSIALISTVVAGATGAFFTGSDTAAAQITTGSLAINLQNQNSEDDFSFNLAGMVPGQTAVIGLDIVNDGSIPVHLRGAAFGQWTGAPALDATKIRIMKIERWDGSNWVVVDDTGPITGLFYYSPDGTDTGLITVGNNEKAQLQLTIEFNPDAGNDYQGRTYNAAFVIQAKQANGSSTFEAMTPPVLP